LPKDKAHLLVTTELDRVLETRHVFADGRAVTIDLPIKDSYAPNIYLSVAYVRDGQMYEHSKSVSVPSANKFLNIELMSDKREYKPRDPASYTVTAKNADGTPAAGVEVSLGLVDEAVYSIRPDSSGDIRKAFYGRRFSSVSTNFSAAFQFTGYSGDKRLELAMNKRSYQLADFKNDRLQVFDADGSFITKLAGEATLSKWGRERVELDPVMVKGRQRVQGLEEREKPFQGPIAVDVDDENRVFVVECARHRLQVFRKQSAIFSGGPV